MPKFRPLVVPMRSRGRDDYGSGQPGSARDHGRRSHAGLDILAEPNARVYTPMDCDVIREAFPYKDDHSLRGILLRGVDEFAGFEVKLFYVNGLFSGRAKVGDLIGHAMSLQKKYPGISNHIHFEIRRNGQWIDPRSCFLNCF